MNEEVKALRSELALVKLQFSQRLGAVENRLNNLLAQEEISAEQYQEISQVEDNNLAHTQPSSLRETAAGVAVPKPVPPKSKIDDEYSSSSQEVSAATFVIPSFITVIIQTILSSFFDWLSPVTQLYQSYKARGMLGIFVLTIVGIGLTLAGFGYLMQLLIDQLGAGYKSLLMCLAAFSVMGVGIGLKIKTRFAEFATAIVTLGILLAYSTVYFSGSVYGLIPNMVVLILYLAIALLCHTLAQWLDTKVVSALGIIGIATMPMLSNVINIEPVYYLLSLAFVAASSLVLSYKHVGIWLAHLSLAFTFLSIEWIIGFESILISAWLVNLFYLLFFSYVCISLYKENSLIKQRLTFLAALVGTTILLFWQATSLFTSQISVSFSLNTLIAVAVSVFFYKVKRELTHFFILLAASWGVLTIVSAISDAYWGIVWAIEGIFLLAIGRRYNFSNSITQGQILTAIALLYSWSALLMYFPLPALKSVDGWVLSLMIAAIIAIWQRLINDTKIFDQLSRNKVKPFLQLLEAIWLSTLLVVSADIWLGQWTGAMVIFIQLALLFRARSCQQVSIEILAAFLVIVPLFYVYQGGLIADSYRFMMLPLFAKLALISVFLQLWLWSAFYRKCHVDSKMKNVAEALRIVFYMLIPICWVGSVIRRFDEESLMLLWGSPLLALLLASKVKHFLLYKETQILTGLASLAFVIAIGELSLINSIIALSGFTGFYAFAYYLNRKNSADIHQFICSWGVLMFGFAVPNIVGSQTDSLFYGIITAGVYWTAVFTALNQSEHLKRNETFITVVNILLVVAAWLLTSSSASYAIVPAIFIFACLYQKEQRFARSKLAEKLKFNGDLLLHSIAVITYVCMFYSLETYRLELLISPVLAVHGAMILFLKDRRLTTVKFSFVLILLGIVKLAMIDAANALLWQKVILFMGIGIFILLASFWYQKLVNSRETSIS
ncbi:DUF2339 domain-containing protein [Colwellia psychrerythraea]|uniref:DUF2339 domain-containing protein n=1 Tax=Colwellia psychrerythraea TaxID=28229 RepID=A0A099L402_COLPS|nr:DUF2339 domain-containing protein [Colwellia psychrerythraea]KGJ96892.1 Protein of unknown function DUF2339, transmembrane [Colwellia psychrerythraea]